MKHFFCFQFLLFVFFFGMSQNQIISEQKANRRNYQEVKIQMDGFSVIEKFAMYPNGIQGIQIHIQSHIKYPKNAKKERIQGTVVVNYLVDTDGHVKDIKIIKSIDPSIDNEAVRVIRKMKRWIPAVQNGRYVKCRYQQAIDFKIN